MVNAVFVSKNIANAHFIAKQVQSLQSRRLYYLLIGFYKSFLMIPGAVKLSSPVAARTYFVNWKKYYYTGYPKNDGKRKFRHRAPRGLAANRSSTQTKT